MEDLKNELNLNKKRWTEKRYFVWRSSMSRGLEIHNHMLFQMQYKVKHGRKLFLHKSSEKMQIFLGHITFLSKLK